MNTTEWLSNLKISSFGRWLLHPGRSLLHGYIRFAGKQRVMAGPFQGMIFSPYNWHVLLGTYELEIYPAFARLFQQEFDQIINVGAEFGFYSVGLALRYSGAEIVAFEKELWAHAYIKRNIEANQVSKQVRIQGLCTAENLAPLLHEKKKTLLLVDVEGYEKTLLDPAILPELSSTAMLVETHDFEVAGCCRYLYDTYCATHEIIKYTSRPRTMEDYPLGRLPFPLLKQAAIEVMTEGRPAPQDWLLLLPKCSCKGADGNRHIGK